MKPSEILNELLDPIGIHDGDPIYEMIETGLDYAPYIGRIYQTYKIRRMSARLKEHEEALKLIRNLLKDSTHTKEFIQNRIFPIVLGDLLEEHEEKKLIYIFNGFRFVLVEPSLEENNILNYFDTLRNLRLYDLIVLNRFYAKESSLEEELSSPFHTSIVAKLQMLGLIRRKHNFQWGDTGKEIDIDALTITSYGDDFIKFIS